MRRMPLRVWVSQTLCATFWTVSRCPQNRSISGMNGNDSSSPLSSSVARISASLRTSTTLPTFKVVGGACSTVPMVSPCPAKRRVDRPGVLQRGNPAQALMPFPHQVVEAEPVALVSLGELLDALPYRPLRSERRHLPGDEVTGNPVVARVRAGARRVRHATADDLAHKLGHVADQVVLRGVADVEGAGMHHLARRLQQRQECRRDV